MLSVTRLAPPGLQAAERVVMVAGETATALDLAWQLVPSGRMGAQTPLEAQDPHSKPTFHTLRAGKMGRDAEPFLHGWEKD